MLPLGVESEDRAELRGERTLHHQPLRCREQPRPPLPQRDGGTECYRGGGLRSLQTIATSHAAQNFVSGKRSSGATNDRAIVLLWSYELSTTHLLYSTRLST